MLELVNINPRQYQLNIADSCLKENTLVVLPTGLGKTIIALIVASKLLSEDSSSKVLVMAPTRPLALQHMKTFMRHLNLDKEYFALLTGEIRPSERSYLWDSAKIVFATPQTIYNDALAGRISLKEVVLAVFDEAHRCVKDYTYTRLAKMYMAEAKSPRIIGLTASPGGEFSRVKEITNNLFIKKVESRTESDEDVKPYVKPIEIESVRLKIPDEYKSAILILEQLLKERIDKLKELGLLDRGVSKKALLQMRKDLSDQLSSEEERKKKGYLFTALITQVQAVILIHALELLQTQGAFAVAKYIDRIKYRKNTKSVRLLMEEEAWERFEKELESIINVDHPKYIKLVQIIREQLQKKEDSRILVFAQYRDTIEHLVSKLKGVGFDVEKFVGQADRAESTGMRQYEQQEVIESFREGSFRILVSSSVGEEGLDIPSVDTVIFYDAVPSEIRAIQRRGRTGRGTEGRVVVLLAEGTVDMPYYYSSIAREKKMRRIISSGKIKRKEPTLFDFT